ncbi:MAG TPA: hypothetical protein VID07_02995 [Actinomycetes bacterium]
MAELLGYLGGTLAVVGAGLLAARFWPDLALWARLSLVGLAAVALWAAGALVPEQAAPALWRLRGVLWLGSSAAVAFLAALVGTDMLDLDGEAVALLAGLVTAIHASVLWWRRPRPLQQLACLAGLAVAAGAGVAVTGGNEAAVGLSIWAVGVLWVLGGWRALLPPPVVALVAGAVVVLQGAQATAVRWEGAGLVFGLASAAGLLAAGTTGRRLALAVVGIIGVVMFLPATVVHFFAGTVGVPVLLLLTGVVLLALTMTLLRWRPPPGTQAPPMPAGGRPARGRVVPGGMVHGLDRCCPAGSEDAAGLEDQGSVWVGDDGFAEGGGGDEDQVGRAAGVEAVAGEVEDGGAAEGGELQGGGQVLVAAGAGSPGEQGGPREQVAVAPGGPEVADAVGAEADAHAGRSQAGQGQGLAVAGGDRGQ